MEPLRGGLLASETSPIRSLLRSADPSASMASWALRFVAQLDGVFVTLSGMSTLEQMNDNVATYASLKPLSADEQATINKAVDIIKSAPRIACTVCRYCTDECPSKLSIPELINIYNDYIAHNTVAKLAGSYMWCTMNSGKARDCTACRVCEENCPQDIRIADIMAKMSELFD